MLITKQPENKLEVYGQEVILSVSATGPETINYQWLRSDMFGTFYTCSSAGSQTSSLYFESFSCEDVGRYKCIISNDLETEVLTSSEVSLTGKSNGIFMLI